MTFTATVDQTGSHTNIAEVTKADQPDTDSTPGNGCEGAAADEDDCAAATVIANESGGSQPDVCVKTNTPTGTLDGYLDASGNPRTITYTLTVTAGAGADEEDVVITDTVPDGTALVAGSLTCDPPGTCNTTVGGDDLAWGLGTLPAGTSRSVHFTVTVLPPTAAQAAAGSWTVTNVGFATSTTHETPSNEVDNEVVVRPLTPRRPRSATSPRRTCPSRPRAGPAVSTCRWSCSATMRPQVSTSPTSRPTGRTSSRRRL